MVSVLLTSVVGDGGSESGPGGATATDTDAVSSAGASSAPTCSGLECDGLDPKATGCGTGARTLKYDLAGTMRLEIRYGPACRTVWGKLTGAEVGDTVEIQVPPTRRQIDAVQNNHDKYTPMLYLPEGQDLSVEATAVAVNPKKRQVKHRFELSVSVDSTDLPTDRPRDLSTDLPTDVSTGPLASTSASGRAS
ncbi:DUF2690 domain-containing protein [Streptomyces acidicola]|uniref:DUF2690 domain-containing protein n=1 Tax=Streptomyces acidicola TaxID=2596892 RepID=A0A5N8X3R1_9ACTN|nr:DUF2690 domain-containing protein [Streptomyces acidicola]MPY53686.1 DUF2690 domain-containing protein [Streptomyces acidicola]